jgi:SAM-dependent methyltransferase
MVDRLTYIDEIRAAELGAILPYLRHGMRILEIGAGSGRQALELSKRGFDVCAIDLASSDYVDKRVFPITDYDGHQIPHPEREFDLVFSSNVLEHVTDLPEMYREIRRVLKPGGECLHVVPTHAWRFWTTAAAVPSGLFAMLGARSARQFYAAARHALSGFKRHGERGNALTELRLFHPSWWRRHFRESGFKLIEDRPVGYFYTAEQLLGPRWSWEKRERLAATLGSATHLFHLEVPEESQRAA